MATYKVRMILSDPIDGKSMYVYTFIKNDEHFRENFERLFRHTDKDHIEMMICDESELYDFQGDLED